ncbi:uncharacterized protein LOC125238336 [Leguminivora glycinivorella]|uniref:uncharacterized protein LOC125226827 n=1 Tax=Leguminivora glycinivorella TaxID=1035111 RepID=UPI00200E7B6B|nr:uncharacterized protein LOC125226827 [Leguminivora glycinivorella]XP_048001593.1 uncharacterized protein LOC125238336 [Leguminivora glycinivorella]
MHYVVLIYYFCMLCVFFYLHVPKDDLEKAKKKLKLVEDTSDIQTEAETEPSLKRKRQKRYISSSSDEDKHIRPPPLKKKLQPLQAADNEGDYGDSRQAQPNIAQETASIAERTLSLLNVADELPILKNSVMQDLADDGDGRLTPFARQVSPRCQYEQPSNIGSDEPAATPSRVQGLTGYQTKVLSLLTCIKTQNDQIISLLKHTGTSKGSLKPEFKFPIQNADELTTTELLIEKKENYDNLVSYMRTIGGRDIASKVSRLMKFCFTDQLAQQYNFYGKRSNKKPFCQLRLRDCIVEGVVTTTSGSTAKDVEDSIKIWLKHAPERLKKIKQQ